MSALLLRAGAFGLVLIGLAAAASADDGRDHCAYMHHESKAYKACMAEPTVAKSAVESVHPIVIDAPEKTLKAGSGAGQPTR